VYLYAGDVATSTRPVVLHTLLGSCVAVCLYDPALRAGGMNHILLPGSRLDPDNTRYGINAMELLINDLMKKGGNRHRFIAKAFGGANVLPGLKTALIGDMNATFAREFLSVEGIPLVAERLGGRSGVNVQFHTDTGEALVRSVDGSRLPKIISAEHTYWRSHLNDGRIGGEITLF
jgi:chemotaxis protein CheD